MLKTIVRSLCLAVLVFFAASGEVRAQKILDTYKKPLPEMAQIPQAEFEAKTRLESYNFDNDSLLSFTVRLPADWKTVADIKGTSFSLSDRILSEIVRYAGEAELGIRSALWVEAMLLKYQMSAEQWLLQYLLERSYPIQGMHSYNEDRAEAIFVLVENGETSIVRALAVRNGKRLILVQYALPIGQFDTEKQIQNQVVDSFSLVNVSDDYVEDMQEYKFLDIAALFYPASWQLRSPPIRSIDRMDAELLNINENRYEGSRTAATLDGKIAIDIVSYYVASSAEEEFAAYKKELEKEGLIVERLSEDNISLREKEPYMESLKTSVYEMIDQKNNILDYELWVTVISAGEYYNFITLMTPSRDEDFFLWSRNLEAYKLVVRHFAPQKQADDGY